VHEQGSARARHSWVRPRSSPSSHSFDRNSGASSLRLKMRFAYVRACKLTLSARRQNLRSLQTARAVARSLSYTLADRCTDRARQPTRSQCRFSTVKTVALVSTSAASCPPASAASARVSTSFKFKTALPVGSTYAAASGSLCFLQTFTAFLQFIGEHYSTTGQDQIIFFETKDRMSTCKGLESSLSSLR
jgi:hypothetical protein